MTSKAPKTQRRYGIPVGYIGTAEVRALLNKGQTTIWRMVNDGRLPKPLRDGKIKIWDEKEIKNWIRHAKFCRKK
jgi:predicted DNA-binding transcriptional regulator AlpA